MFLRVKNLQTLQVVLKYITNCCRLRIPTVIEQTRTNFTSITHPFTSLLFPIKLLFLINNSVLSKKKCLSTHGENEVDTALWWNTIQWLIGHEGDGHLGSECLS